MADWQAAAERGEWGVPENIRLIRLPGFAPELNPEEHLGDEVREKAFPNPVLDRRDLGVARLKAALSGLAAEPDRVRTVTAWPWIVSINLKANWNEPGYFTPRGVELADRP